MLYRSVYISTATSDISYEKIKTLCEVAAKHNKKAGITGILVFNRKYFIQMLEGTRESVNNTLMRIIANSLHKDIQILSFSKVTSRMFRYYGIKMFAETGEGSAIMFKYTNSLEFNPYFLDEESIYPFISEVSGLTKKSHDVDDGHIIKIYQAS